MSLATRTDTPSPARHVADSHDLIRVHGARENNLKDVSVEIPKRRLTVFTGVSGSGKSSLVFDTIAAESQRMINETYSAFVQGFMPTLARPEVDVLDGLTTAIIVDQERMGSNPRSTVGTAPDANAMLRILFSRLGQPHIGSPNAYSFNVPSVKASGAITIERGAGKTKTEKATFTRLGGMCSRCEGMGSVTDFDLAALYDDSLSLNEGALTIPGYSMDGWYGRIFRGCGFFDPDKPIRKFNKKELHAPLHMEPTKIKVEGINLTYAGLIPSIQKSFLSKDVDALQPHIRAFVERAVTFTTCPDCGGTRLNEAARSSKIKGINIAALSNDGRHLYAADTDLGVVGVIDTRDDRVIKTIRVGLEPWRIYMSHDGRYGITVNNDHETISIIDTRTNSVVATLEAGPDMTGVNFAGGKAFGTIYIDVRAVRYFSMFLAEHHPQIVHPAGLTRAVIEHYISWLATSHLAGYPINTYLVTLRGFLEACRRHQWLTGLSTAATVYLDELPPRPRPLPRFIDEFVMGFGKRIEISLEEKTIAVRDYGRGIPLGKLFECAAQINTGAKYDSEAFKKSVGLNGVGIKAVNALSSSFEIQAFREKETRRLEFSRGNLLNDSDIEAAFASAPGTPALFGACAPKPRNTASYSRRSSDNVMSHPSRWLQAKRTPFLRISSTRRATTSLSSLNEGIPWTSSPPGRSSDSNTVTSHPPSAS